MFGKKFIPGVRVEVDADSEEFNPNKVITFFLQAIYENALSLP